MDIPMGLSPDELMAEALETTGLRTKKAVIEEALRTLVRLGKQGQVRSLRGKLQWEGDLDLLREGRLANLVELGAALPGQLCQLLLESPGSIKVNVSQTMFELLGQVDHQARLAAFHQELMHVYPPFCRVPGEWSGEPLKR
jgi:Arc/MetJ family transcription regulator